MEQIIRIYGKSLLEMLALVLLVIILFSGITDESGNQGIMHIIGAWYEPEVSVERNDFEIYQREAQKEAPSIFYSRKDTLSIGKHYLSDCIVAKDMAGNNLQLQVLELGSEQGECTAWYEEGTEEIVFTEAGIYSVKVSAVDNGNRRSICQIKLPVSR